MEVRHVRGRSGGKMYWRKECREDMLEKRVERRCTRRKSGGKAYWREEWREDILEEKCGGKAFWKEDVLDERAEGRHVGWKSRGKNGMID